MVDEVKKVNSASTTATTNDAKPAAAPAASTAPTTTATAPAAKPAAATTDATAATTTAAPAAATTTPAATTPATTDPNAPNEGGESTTPAVTKGVFAFDFTKTPITKVADDIIITGSDKAASDIHFDPREDGMMVRYRVDGELQDYTFIPKKYERNLTTRLKLLAGMNITESRLPQDGAIKGEFGGKYLDMRVSCLPLNEGEKVVIRILDYSRSLQGIDSLGFNKVNLEKLKRMMGVPNGIILVTGATGSGKSTTTYSVLQGLNKPEVNIITVEDPIEMNIEGMNQVQVNSEIGMTFAAALRSILRQDPNVILIGEIRDSETAQIAVRASITGHLVLSTIHTNNSLATIERLLDMDVERYLLSTALTGIISQRLAKQLCMKCRIKRPATKYEQKVFKRYMNIDVEDIYDANENGCEHCRRGYKGRIAIQEVLELDEDIRNALTNEKLRKEDLKKMVYTDKTITMLQDALGKALAGLTSFAEVYRVIEIEDDWEKEKSDLTSSLDNEEETSTVKLDLASIASDISLGENDERDSSDIEEVKSAIDEAQAQQEAEQTEQEQVTGSEQEQMASEGVAGTEGEATEQAAGEGETTDAMAGGVAEGSEQAATDENAIAEGAGVDQATGGVDATGQTVAGDGTEQGVEGETNGVTAEQVGEGIVADNSVEQNQFAGGEEIPSTEQQGVESYEATGEETSADGSDQSMTNENYTDQNQEISTETDTTTQPTPEEQLVSMNDPLSMPTTTSVLIPPTVPIPITIVPPEEKEIPEAETEEVPTEDIPKEENVEETNEEAVEENEEVPEKDADNLADSLAQKMEDMLRDAMNSPQYFIPTIIANIPLSEEEHSNFFKAVNNRKNSDSKINISDIASRANKVYDTPKKLEGFELPPIIPTNTKPFEKALKGGNESDSLAKIAKLYQK